MPKEWKDQTQILMQCHCSPRVLYTKDPSISEIVAKIPVFQHSEKQEKLLSFYSSLGLNYNYFWKLPLLSKYMKIRAAAEIVYCCYRIVLQENKILFPSNRRLEETVAAVPNKLDNIVELGNEFIEHLDDETAEKFVNSLTGWMSYEPPEDYSEALTTYVNDYELWWKDPRPNINEW